jgi:hypothetical protein
MRTEAWVSGNASVWTITAGRGFRWSPDAATSTTSPRLIARVPVRRVEFGDGLDPAQSVIFAVWDETEDLSRNAPAD